MEANGHDIAQLTDSLKAQGLVRPLEPARALSRDGTPPKVPGMPPNLGEFAVPHVHTFQGILSTISKVYRPSDEALKHSLENAQFMRNDPTVMECVEQRQRSLALLDWHLEPDDADDPRQVELCDELKAIIEATPRFMQYRENLSHAVWFGRYAISHIFRWKRVRGQMRVCLHRWTPIHGDKVVFRFDDGRHEYDDQQVGIRVNTMFKEGDKVANRWTVERIKPRPGAIGGVEPTDRGLAYFLPSSDRDLVAIHKHYIEDGEFEDPANAGRIHGVGLRSRLYWIWVQKQELLAWLMEYLERSAFGIELWYYPWGNDEAREKTQEAAQKRIGDGRNIVLVPKPLGEEGMAYGVDRIEPGMAGADIVHKIVTEYFGHQIKRYILGQTLTSEAGSTGLGSNLASIHLDTYMQIIRYDATNLEETLTTDLVQPLLRFNFPRDQNTPIRFVIETEAPDAESKLQAMQAAWNMGARLRESDIYDLIGLTPPDEGDVTLTNPQIQQAQQQMQQAAAQAAMPQGMPGQQPGMPADPNAAAGQPPQTDEQQIYGALQADRDSKKMAAALGVSAPETGEREKIESGSPADPVGWPTEEEQIAAAMPHPSGYDPDKLGAAIAQEMKRIPDVALATKVAQKQLDFDANYYDREDYARERYGGRKPAAGQHSLWNEADHPRGQPDNAGQFGSKPGGATATLDPPSKKQPPQKPATTPKGAPAATPKPAQPKPGQTANAHQMAQQATPAFKNWFAGSVVTNPDGSPRLMYHGTKGADFNEFRTMQSFDLGSHFGTVDQADDFTVGVDDDHRPGVFQVYLSVKNPLRMKDRGAWFWDDMLEQLEAAGVPIPDDIHEQHFDAQEALESADPKNRRDRSNLKQWENETLRGLMEAAGYDGIVYLNDAEGFDNAKKLAVLKERGYSHPLTDDELRALGAEDSYVCLRPTQIKSATGNAGSFDGANPDIRYARDGLVERFSRAFAERGFLAGNRLRYAFDESKIKRDDEGKFAEKEGMGSKRKGSANFEEAQRMGYVVGKPKYAPWEPHHQKSEGGAWTYETMYHEPTEKLLIEIFEGTGPAKKEGCHLRWSEEGGTRLVVHDSGEAREIKLPNEELVLDFPDGGVEIGNGEYETFDGVIGREG